MERMMPIIFKVILIVFFNFNCGIQREKHVCSEIKMKGSVEGEMANTVVTSP